MTPDRPEHTNDESEHGVLSDTGSLDTAGFGILGGATAQVSVELPGAAGDEDDDLVEDDVAMPEVAVEQFSHDEVVEAEVEADAAADDTVDTDAFAHDADELVHDTDDVAVETGSIDSGSHDAAPATSTFDALIAGGSVPLADDRAPEAAPAAAVSQPDRPQPASSRPAVAEAAPAPAASQPDRSQHVERIVAPAEVALTSKRLGEFEPDRETADLLTADRLLDPSHVVRSEPEGAWQHFLYSISGHRINLGDSKRARARKELDRRIAAPLSGGARFVPVLSRKGGVGKTTVTTLLGMALADARDDRVIAVDANPDRGTLAERISRATGKTVRDVVRIRGEVVGYNDLSGMVARDETRLDVIASDSDPRVSEAFSDQDYRDVASLAAHYYSIVLTDTGTGIVHSVMEATLSVADQLVVVAGLSVDEARLASETLTWLETNGYASQVRNAVVVINSARPGSPMVRLEELEAHFKTRVRTVVRMPYDQHIAAGSAITFRDLQPETREAARELAAAVVEGLRALAPAA